MRERVSINKVVLKNMKHILKYITFILLSISFGVAGQTTINITQGCCGASEAKTGVRLGTDSCITIQTADSTRVRFNKPLGFGLIYPVISFPSDTSSTSAPIRLHGAVEMSGLQSASSFANLRILTIDPSAHVQTSSGALLCATIDSCVSPLLNYSPWDTVTGIVKLKVPNRLVDIHGGLYQKFNVSGSKYELNSNVNNAAFSYDITDTVGAIPISSFLFEQSFAWMLGVNFGIGTTTPNALLDVQGNLHAELNGFAQHHIFASAVGSSYDWFADYSGSQTKMQDASGNYVQLVHNATTFETQRITATQSNKWLNGTNGIFYYSDFAGIVPYFKIDTTGYVGIGTSNPTTKLEIAGDIFQHQDIGDEHTNFQNDKTALNITHTGGAANYGYTSSSQVSLTQDTANQGINVNDTTGTPMSVTIGRIVGVKINTPYASLGYPLLDISTTDPIFYVGDNGSVGIGTISPTAKLDVVGEIGLRNSTNLADSVFIYAGDIAPSAYQPTHVIVGLINTTDDSGDDLVGYQSYYGTFTNTQTDTLTVASAFRFVDGNQAAGFVLTSDASGNASWQAPSATVDHITGNSGTPSIAAGTGAGTSPTVSIEGTNIAGVVTVTTGTLPTGASNIIATITYNGLTYGTNSYVVISENSDAPATSLLTGVSMVGSKGNTTGFTITSGTTALTAATTYKWNYIVVGK